MAQYPKPIEDLIGKFSLLPGVGRKTAERYVFYLLKRNKREIDDLSLALNQLKTHLSSCPKCGHLSSDKTLCEICADAKRQASTLCVVEESHDLIVIESTQDYHGLYHVLGGTLNPIEGITDEQLNIKKLLDRVKEEKITEVIFALNPDLAGEATILYLKKILTPFKIKLTRLARGLPMGSDIEYADEVTLSNALRGRKEI